MKQFKQPIQKATEDLGFKQLTDIQKRVIPLALKKHSIIATSATGTGKSHAFLIPIFEMLDVELKHVQAVILSPTRELAKQIHDMAVHMASFFDTPINIQRYTGGQDRAKELEKLTKQQPHIIIGTPGKIHDLVIQSHSLKVYHAPLLVIDEADMALEIGFLDDIYRITSAMNPKTQIMVFSATIPQKLQPFLNQFLTKPKMVDLSQTSAQSLDIEHRFVRVNSDQDKRDKLLSIIDAISPYMAMIFINKKEDIDDVVKILYQKGIKVTPLHGGLEARKRKQILREVMQLSYQYIVASDIAARGLDIEGVSHIINYDIPHDLEFYTHRIGRTGRMGHSGVAITLYKDRDLDAIETLKHTGFKIAYKDIRDGQWIDKDPDKRKKRVDTKVETTKHPLKKPKQVKPNYKKKLKSQQKKRQH